MKDSTSQITGLRGALLDWFRAEQRDLPWRRTGDPYLVWVSEVMLQQTRVSTVIPYFESFVEKYPDVLTLAQSDLQTVLKSWEGLGYYARARNLHKAAKLIAERHDGKLPADYDRLRTLPGVGDYIGAAVSSIAFGEPRAVLDGNVKRVLARMWLISEPSNTSRAAPRFKQHADRLLDRTNPGDFNQAMMELGAQVCLPRSPRCEFCPVSRHCEAYRDKLQGEFPVRQPRRAIPEYHIAVGVVEKEGRVLITQREPDGLLGGLWEFPGGKVTEGETAANACRREIEEEVNLDVEVTDHLTHIDHAYTHFRIGVDVFACRYRAGDIKLQGPVDYRWVIAEEIDDYPFPGANHKFLPLVKQRLKSNA